MTAVLLACSLKPAATGTAAAWRQLREHLEFRELLLRQRVLQLAEELVAILLAPRAHFIARRRLAARGTLLFASGPLCLARGPLCLALLREHALDLAFLIRIEIEKDRQTLDIERAAAGGRPGGLGASNAGGETDNSDERVETLHVRASK
jgi:hypothetical protein